APLPGLAAGAMRAAHFRDGPRRCPRTDHLLPVEPRVRERRHDPAPLYMRRREHLAAAPLGGTAARDGVPLALDGRPRREAVRPLERERDLAARAFAACRRAPAARGRERVRQAWLRGTVPAAGPGAPAHPRADRARR